MKRILMIATATLSLSMAANATDDDRVEAREALTAEAPSASDVKMPDVSERDGANNDGEHGEVGEHGQRDEHHDGKQGEEGEHERDGQHDDGDRHVGDLGTHADINDDGVPGNRGTMDHDGPGERDERGGHGPDEQGQH